MGDGVTAVAPGRVNLIGDHTDYTGGLAMPMAVDLATTVTGERTGDAVTLRSASEPMLATVPLDVTDPATLDPPWARYVAGVVAELCPSVGFVGHVATTLPVGAGLSSSAALEVAVALALGATGSPLDLAQLCQRAEQRASGVPCGTMDQLTSAAGVAGHALLLDCHACTVEPVPLPAELDVVVVHSGEERRLADSAYGERRARCEAAEEVVGPLRLAGIADLDAIVDPVTRRRARHVVTENERVRAFADALRGNDPAHAGALMLDSHRSLRDLYGVSTTLLDALVDRLAAIRGVYGARLTGAGFGGCVVALTAAGSLTEGWTVRAADGARLLPDERSPRA